MKHTFFSQDALRSVPWLVVGKGISFVLYFLSSILIVRYLSPDHYGAFSLIKSLAEFLIIFCGLGLNFSLLRFLPELRIGRHFYAIARLISRAVTLEGLALLFVASLIVTFSSYGTKMFSIDFSLYVWPLLALMVGFLSKEFFSQVLTALYLTKFLSFLTVLQSVLLFFLIVLWTQSYNLEASGALYLYSLSLAVGAVFSFISLIGYLGRQKEKREGGYISPSRVAFLSVPAMIRSVFNKLLEQYSEIFFLGYFQATAFVGYYVLGSTIPQLLITFIPLSLHALFTSAFSETYSNNRESLSDLMEGMYQILILVCVPLSCFGAFFSTDLIVWIYGEKMSQAGPVASFFFIFKLLPLVWIPLAMAITAKEKLLHTLWIDFLPLLINLPLDYFLIQSYGINGAMIAVALSFLLTLPLKIWYLKRLIGPICFPFSFFFRLGGAAFLLAFLLYLPFSSIFSWGLIFLAISYGCLFLLAIRFLPLIREEDVLKFRGVGIEPLNKIFDLITGQKL